MEGGRGKRRGAISLQGGPQQLSLPRLPGQHQWTQGADALLHRPLQPPIPLDFTLENADLLLGRGRGAWNALEGALHKLAAHQVLTQAGGGDNQGQQQRPQNPPGVNQRAASSREAGHQRQASAGSRS